MSKNAFWLFPALVLCAGLHTAFAQGTAFTYQGWLNDGGVPANGNYDLTFTMYTTNSGGSAFAGSLTNSAVGVTNGLFTITLDFGSGVFYGDPRWLEIGVRTNGNGSFATLSPRQQLTPTPYAIFANTASQLTGNALQQLDNQASIVANSIVSTATNNLLTTANSNIQSATNNALATATNSFLSINTAIPTTNGLASTDFVNTVVQNGTNNLLITANGVIQSATNNALTLASNSFYGIGNPSGFQTASQVQTATNNLLTTANGNIQLATNILLGTVTNVVTNQGYVTSTITNGLATTNYVDTAVQDGTNNVLATATNSFYGIGNPSGFQTAAQVQTATNNALATATNSFLSINTAIPTTNGLVSTNFVNTVVQNGTNNLLITASGVIQSATNNALTLASNSFYGVGNSSGFQTAAQVQTATNNLLITANSNIQSSTNNLLTTVDGVVQGATNNLLTTANSGILSATNNLLVVATNAANLIGLLPQYPTVQIATNAPFTNAVLISPDGTNRVWSAGTNLFDVTGAAQNSTNNFVGTVNATVQGATNNALATASNSFDSASSALNATNAFASGELLTATNNVLATAYNLALSNVVYLETNSIILTNNGNYNGLCVTNLTNASSINFIAGGTITSTTLGQSLTLNTAASSSSSSGNISISPGNSTYVSGNGGSITLTPGSGNGANGGGGSLTLNGGNSGDGDYSGGQISLSGGNHASSSQGTIAIKGAGGGSGTGGGSVTISGGAAGSVATSGNVTINTPNTTTPGIITIEAGSSKGMTFTSTYVSNNLPLVQINTMSIAGALGVSNVVVTNNITVNGTNTTGYYIGNGAGLTNIPTGNISGLGSAAFQNTSFFDLAGTGTAAAQAVTNGYPWGTLYDSSGAALAATNAFASGELVSATNNLLIVATNATNLIGSLPQYPRVQIATNAPFAGAVLTSSDGTNRVWSGQLNNIITNIGATNYFISTNIQNIGGLTGIIFTNTFGTPPPAMRVVLVCVTANNGYHVGDEVNFEGAWNQDFAEPECATFASSTNFGANFPEAINQSAPGIWVGNFNLYNLPNGWTNWNLKLYAMWGSGGSYALLTPTNGMTGSDVTNTIQALADTTGTAQSATNNLLTTANGNIQSATNNLLATASNSFRQTLFTGWGDVTYNSKTETAVYSVTIPANMLNANGNAIVSMHEYKCSFGGQNFFTTNRFWFGTTNYLTTAFPAASSGGEYITTLYFIRTNSTTARVAETLAFHAVSGYTSGNVPDDQFVDVTNLNFAQANTFQITAALSTNYLATTIFKWAKIEFVP